MNKIRHLWKFKLMQLSFFFVISILGVMTVLIHHTIPDAYDIQFHFSRIADLKHNWQIGNLWPQLNLFTFNHTGVPVFLMYPFVNLIPITLLSLILPTLPLAIIWMWMVLYLGLLSSYYSCHRYTSSNWMSLTFAIIYMLSYHYYYFSWASFNYGCFTTLIGIPMILFGVLNLIKNNRWQLLMWGLVIVVNSHVLTSILMILLLCVLLIINYHRLKKAQLQSIGKVIGWSLGLTTITWLPLIIFGMQNQLNPPLDIGFKIVITIPQEIWHSIFDLDFKYKPILNISIWGLIGLVIGLIGYRRLSKIERQLLWIGWATFIISTNFVPWYLFHYTFINNLQFPYRILLITQPISCYLFVKIMNNWINDRRIKLIITIVILSLNLINLNALFIHNYQTTVQDNELTRKFDFANDKQLLKYYPHGDFTLQHSKDFKYLINSHSYGIDYTPAHNLYLNTFAEQKAIVGENQTMTRPVVQTHYRYNGTNQYTFSLKHYHQPINLIMPIYIYHGIDYQIKLDGQPITIQTDNNTTLVLRNIKPGHHRLTVQYHMPIYVKIGIAISSISLLAYLTLLTLVWKQRRCNHD